MPDARGGENLVNSLRSFLRVVCGEKIYLDTSTLAGVLVRHLVEMLKGKSDMGVEQPITLELDTEAYLELGFVPNTGLFVDVVVGDSDEDIGTTQVLFSDMVDDLADAAADIGSNDLYCIAHELRRFADVIYDLAQERE